MTIATPSVPATPTPAVHHGHHKTPSTGSASSAGPSAANESLQQLADQGDPLAIAELKAEHPQPPAAAQASAPAADRTGTKEPGKGDLVDAYA